MPGWYKDGDYWRYIQKNGYYLANSWYQDTDGKYYYFNMGAVMAALILAVIPVVIFYLACQKHIIKGVAAGAVKGK